ncbi:hypothetical protein F3Y22_tig00112686pilonHSYRG00019 [Hibiscus syriacus]|uniref:C2 domain-containing protein n=1 Tax=Hibiscus syriacus TaxID=106335 RepID=A0A6A2WUF1_HIBSY|nr:hypothetical protein F3Y22_tig00112686pilonHSYRG00019 [Hibiscus syriacus]
MFKQPPTLFRSKEDAEASTISRFCLKANLAQHRGRNCDPYVEVKLGNYKGVTKHFEKKSNPEWNQIFAFSKERIQASVLEVFVKDKDVVADDLIGRVMLYVYGIPRRVHPQSPLAPQWYRLEDRKGNKSKGELMLAVWMETQADEAFPDAWHSDATSVSPNGVANIRSKVYLSPKLWYVRMNIIEAQDLVLGDKGRYPEVFVKAVLRNQALRTRISPRGYHILDGSTHYSSDLRPTAKQLWKPNIGILELGQFPPATCQDGMSNTWVVFDPCTVITIGVFDNGGSGETKDARFGKVRIQLSTLEAGRVYTHLYPLLHPLLPKMHYIHPLSVIQLDCLMHQAIQIVSVRLSRAEPPLRKEVVEYMLDVDSHMWSMRRRKANFFRIMGVLILYPELILTTVFLYLFLIGIWNYRWRPMHPPHMDTRLSHADVAHPDERDEEFDTFPTSRPADIVRMRYDRLKSIAGRVQTVIGDLATQGERFQPLLSCRDPRVTTLFVTFCLTALSFFMLHRSNSWLFSQAFMS